MKNKSNTIIVTAVVLIFVGLIIKNIIESNSLRNNGIYVIGNIEKIEPGSGGLLVSVRYSFRGKTYNARYLEVNWEQKRPVVGRYFFKIDAKNPRSISVDYDKTVPNSLTDSPSTGWDSLPEY